MPRKLILQMHISMDGYIAAPNQNDMSWVTMDWDDEMKAYITNIAKGVGHILLGRNMAEGFIPHWKARAGEDEAFVKFINGCSKTVFSNTVNDNPWGEEAQVIGGELKDVVKKLKAEDKTGDIIVYGGVRLAQALVAGGLVDELYLGVDPITLGDGARLFTTRKVYESVESIRFECGSTLMRYRPKT